MSREVSASTKRSYGVVLVAAEWNLPRSSLYARRVRSLQTTVPRKRGPKTKWSDEQLLDAIRDDLAATPFVGEGHRKVWARLRVAGKRTSKQRVLRLMREHNLLAPTRAQRVLGPQNHDGMITTERPDEMWGTDLTTTMTIGDGQVAVFIAVDHCTTECVGIHAAVEANRFEALEPVRQAVKARFGAYGQNVVRGLKLRHDHGSQYVSDAFQSELHFLGIESSPAFVRAPEGNGCSERFIRTLKEQLLWVRSFRTVEELRLALHEWVRIYNEQWLVERHGHRPPATVRRELIAIQAAA